MMHLESPRRVQDGMPPAVAPARIRLLGTASVEEVLLARDRRAAQAHAASRARPDVGSAEGAWRGVQTERPLRMRCVRVGVRKGGRTLRLTNRCTLG